MGAFSSAWRSYAWRFIAAGFLGLLSFALTPAVTQAAFGISPPFMNTDHLVPGVSYQQTVYLVQDQPNSDLRVTAELKVPDAIRSWFTVDRGYDFVIPQGMRQFPVVITVNVPKSAGLGRYSGNLTFATQPTTGGQVAIALGANVAINLTVGQGVFESYKATIIALPSVEEGWNPRATVHFENDGNIPEAFDYATYEIYDHFGSVRLAYMTKDKGFPTTPPFTTQEYTIEFPTDFHLGISDYWGNATFYKDNQVVATTKAIFHVLPSGSLSPYSIFFNNLKAYWIYLLAGLLAVLFALRRILVARRRRRAA